MPRKKRGQVTIFVALGVILVIVLILAIAFRGNITKIVTESKTETQTAFSAKVDEVQRHIENCMGNSLKEGVFTMSNRKTSSYDQQLASEVMLRFGMCLNMESFTDVTVKKLAEPKVSIQRNQDNTVITATLNMPVSIEKGSDTQQLSEFISQEKLQKTMCVLKEMLDSSCKAQQDLTVGIFTFKQGQEVKINGKCLAC